MIPKFRAWDKDAKKMFDVGAIDFETNELVEWLSESSDAGRCFFNTLDFEDVELMQSTGHYDLNGKEIYIDYLVKDEYGRLYQVVFKGDCIRLEPKPRKGNKNRWIGKDLVIVGNIYENHDLLKEVTE